MESNQMNNPVNCLSIKQGKGNQLSEQKQSIIQSFFDQFNTTEKQFYQGSIVNLQKLLNHGK